MQIRTGVVGLALVLSCIGAGAAPGQAGSVDAEIVNNLHRGLARSFQLPKDAPLDPALRAAASEISAAHLARIDQLLQAWLREERQSQASGGKAPRPNALFFAVWARLLNELALWQVEPGDADYERATLAVLKASPQVCQSEGDARFNDFASRIMRIQAMPVAQRTAALASERQLLSHWGQPRAAVPPLPYPLPQDAAAQAVKRMQEGGKRTGVALSPILASSLLAKKMDIKDLHPETQCAVQQWWLNVSLKQGSTPDAALNAFRYGTLISARERLAGMFEGEETEGTAAAPSDRPPFPKLAARFDVTGVTTLGVQVDDAGRPTQASVTDRKIEVTGIRGVRPVAFENVFDEPSVKFALGTPSFTKPATGPVRFEMVWKLDGPAAQEPPVQAGTPGKKAARSSTKTATGGKK